jgi:HD superfamily phosphodiesterase
MLPKYKEKSLIGLLKRKMIGKEDMAGGMGYRYFHQLRVYNSCKRFLRLRPIRKRIPDENAVLIAALFHDIGRLSYYSDKPKLSDFQMRGHEKESAKLMRKMLARFVDSQTLDRAARLVERPEISKSKVSFEEEFLMEVDSLDEVGVLNLWRMFSVSAFNKRTIAGTLAYYNGVEIKKRKGEWLDRFKIPEVRKVALRRFTEMDKAMEELGREQQSKDI